MTENFYKMLDDVREADKTRRFHDILPDLQCNNTEDEKICADAVDIGLRIGCVPRTLTMKVMDMHGISECGRCTEHEISHGDRMLPQRVKRFADDKEKIVIGKKYICDSNASKAGACKECVKNANRIFKWPEEADKMPKLPLHPNCKCRYEDVYKAEESNKIIKGLAELKNLVQGLHEIWETKIPKPPRSTKHEGVWLDMLWMWFFEQGPNPARFDKNSPYSRDIANSYSMKVIKEEYKKSGEIPKGWKFIGPKTAEYVLGEVEWFIGTYDIKDFKKQDGIITFTVYNCSSWHSGTRLPKSWTDYIKSKTGYEIKDLVTSGTRGNVLKEKIKVMLPAYLQGPATDTILNQLPSFGGNWEQYFEVEVKWKD